jgi:hypothetical protein
MIEGFLSIENQKIKGKKGIIDRFEEIEPQIASGKITIHFH